MILLLGAGRTAVKLRDAMRRLGLECRHEAELERVFAKLEAESAPVPVLLAPPLRNCSAERACRHLVRGKPGTPVFVVGGGSSRQAGRLYRAGASGQFDWPLERAALVRTVLRLAGDGNTGRPPNARDAALAARVQERLRENRETFGPLLKVRAQRGIVFLGGEVDAPWKLTALGRVLSSMPGVDEVVTAGVRVAASDLPDRVVGASVRSVLKSASGLEERTFGTRVSNGRVTLTGTARNRDEMDRVVELVEQVAGVRGVDNLIAVSRPAKQRDSRVARNLSRLLGSQYPATQIDVSVFGGVAVVGGKVRDPRERRAIESLVARQPGVQRVVSKMG